MSRRRASDDGPLTVSDLHRMREARARVNHETYRQVFGEVRNRIRALAQHGGTSYWHQIPVIVPGRPVFKPAHAARYVADKLRRGGFEVRVDSPHPDLHYVHASWTSAPAASPRRRRRRRDPRPPSAAAGRLPVSVEEATRRVERLKARLRLAS